MAVTSNSFNTAVTAWVAKSEARMLAVFKESCQRLVNEAQTPVGAGGNMPIARASCAPAAWGLWVHPHPPRPNVSPEAGQTYTFTAVATISAIASLRLGQTFFFCWTAFYAPFVEYGTSKMRARGFVRLAAQKWWSIVAQVSAEAQSRTGQ